MDYKQQLRFGLDILKHPSIILNIKGLPTIDGHFIPGWSIFWYMTKALYKFPGFYNFRIDPKIEGMTELAYLILTVPGRIKKMQAKGKKVVGKWAINPTDLYFGAGAIALDPFYVAFCHMLATDDNIIAIKGRSELSPDACPAQAAAYYALKTNIVEQDMFYPFIGPWCYDSQYCFEALRDKFKGFFGDHLPVSRLADKSSSKAHMIDEIKTFFRRMEQETGVAYSPERLRNEFILENKLRRLCREIQTMILDPVIPLGSLDLILVTFLACDWLCDPVAIIDMLERMTRHLRMRQKKGIWGSGVSQDPVRLLVTGVAWGDLGLYNMVDDLGGIVVGSECVMSIYWEDIDEDPARDPMEVLAERLLCIPYTLTAKERAKWTLNNLKQMGCVDGVIINCNFGCNYNAGSNRMLADLIKEEAGIPVLSIDSDLPRETREQFRTRFGAFIEMIRGIRQSKKANI